MNKTALIGIIGAMRVEMDALIAKMEQPEQTVISGVTFYRGKLFDRDVVAAVCGVGKVFAALCCEAMILHYAPDLIINIGVGGSLDTALGICDVALAQDAVQHDMDTTPLGDPAGLISGINLVHLPCDKRVLAHFISTVEALGVPYKTGTIASGDQFINSEEQKRRIRTAFNAIACEMEGAAVVHVCHVNRVPVCVMRTVSDTADGSSHMDYSTFVQAAAAQSERIITRFLSTLPPDLFSPSEC